MNIQNLNNLPDFIDKFIKFNMDKLIKIYDDNIEEKIEEKIEGLLYFNCSKEKNKVDVIFLNKEKIEEIMNKDDWLMLKENSGDRKIFLIRESSNIYILTL